MIEYNSISQSRRRLFRIVELSNIENLQLLPRLCWHVVQFYAVAKHAKIHKRHTHTHTKKYSDILLSPGRIFFSFSYKNCCSSL